MEIVADQTGYPVDMLDPDLDLEADLGIDTVKQAETFAAVREAYDVPRDENLQLRDFPTLTHVVGWVLDRRPDLVEPAAPAAAPEAPAAAPEPPAPGDRVSVRRVPVPALRPPLDDCAPTGVTVGEGDRVIVASDGGGVGASLVRELDKRGAVALELSLDGDAWRGQLEEWLADGSIAGVYWLPALDDASKGDGVSTPDAWREALRVRVKVLFGVAKRLYEEEGHETRFFIGATRLGGMHGYDPAGAVAPMGGAVTGFLKTYKREKPTALVKAVDFAPSRRTKAIATVLLEETERDPGVVEIGRPDDGLRWGVGLQEVEAEGEGMTLGPDSVVVVTGAAGSITSAIVKDLASKGGTFVLLDLAPAPPADDPDIAMFRSDQAGLMRVLRDRMAETVERVTPAMVKKEMAGVERRAMAREAIDAVEAAGGTVHYHACDLRDAAALSEVVAKVREAHGKIDLLVHAGGLEISRFLSDKAPQEFDLVFDVKVDGWLALLAAIGDMPLGAAVVFSSIAGRFGNAGQTDYSAANDLLCKWVSSFRRTRPDTLGIALDWTAWGEIGMATRGSIPKMMELARIDMLPPNEGIPWVRQEVEAGTRGEVVAAGGLGVLLEPWHTAGGVTPAEVEHPGPMVHRCVDVTPEGSVVFEGDLDPKAQPFLYDHAIGGTPVLPGVMGMEAFSEAAELASPGWHVHAVEDVRFLAPFKLYRNEPRTARVEVRVQPGPDGTRVASCRLVGSRMLHGHDTPTVTEHFAARVVLRPEPIELEGAGELPAAGEGAVGPEPIYDIFFHGPAYQVLAEAYVDGDAFVGAMKMDVPPNHTPEDAPLTSQPRLVELAFQTAGLMEIAETGVMGLPRALRSVRVAAKPPESPVGAVVRRGDDGSFEVDVVDAEGQRFVHLEGYGTEQLGAVTAEQRATLETLVRDEG
jgi:NAD(P)-dependent dehydrogenase (short-subunit alcohol dehydrogenase family)